jgi:hypothetical protein
LKNNLKKYFSVKFEKKKLEWVVVILEIVPHSTSNYEGEGKGGKIYCA